MPHIMRRQPRRLNFSTPTSPHYRRVASATRAESLAASAKPAAALGLFIPILCVMVTRELHSLRHHEGHALRELYL